MRDTMNILQTRIDWQNPQDKREYWRVYSQQWRAKNVVADRLRNKRYALNRKIAVLTHYGNGELKCVCCGETILEFLTLDHINGGGGKQRRELRKAGQQFYAWLRANKYPEGFRTLCLNCNFAIGHFKECPHHTRNIERNR